MNGKTKTTKGTRRGRAVIALAWALLLGFIAGLSTIPSRSAAAQEEGKARISDTAARQIAALLQEKQSRTREQRKIDSNLLLKMKQSRAGGRELPAELRATNTPIEAEADGRVLVDIKAKVTPAVLDAIKAAGGEVVSSFAEYNAIRARVDLNALETIAGLQEVRFIGPAQEAETGRVERAKAPVSVPKLQAGPKPEAGPKPQARPTRAERAANVRAQLGKALAQRSAARFSSSFAPSSALAPFAFFTGGVNSEGDAAHRADQVRALGINGTGVRIGVLSDSVRNLAASQASNDLPATVTIVPGQSGVAMNDTGEGTAMLEIIHDLAPQAQLFFATANGGQAQFATNINALASAPFNCDIIVDDVSYFDEAVFQDGTVAQAVNNVTAAGVLYFSSAGNAGNVNDGTGGVWEGDFAGSGQTLAAVPGGQLHDFGGGVIGNTINATGGGRRPIVLTWSDPLGGSGNDYDLFILNATLTTVIASSTNTQDGDDDPIELIMNNAMTPVFNAGNRIVIRRNGGAAVRALHVNATRGQLAVNTTGQTHGHSAAVGAFSVAAVPASTAGGNRFIGGATNPVETFSSDGPRRMFFDQAGNAITPGNLLFGTNGGTVRQKPDIAAADGVTTNAPGFNPFFGTSAAAPHAAAIAGLLLSFDNTLTPAQVRAALTSTALDIEAAGTDRDSGAGIVMALQAIGAVSSADLSITKTDSPDPVVAGTNLIYTINVRNNGTGPAVFARISDSLPAGTTFRSLGAPSDWTCATPSVGAGGAVNCRKDTMANGETASFTLTVRVDAAVPDGTTINNTATITSDAADPNGANNFATAATQVIARADLEVTAKTGAPDPVVTNSPLTYTITLRNNGPSAAVNAVLADALPLGALFGSCAATGGGVCGGAAQNRTVSFANLSVGATATVTFNTTANCVLADGAIITNTATLTAATVDPDPTNNAKMSSVTAKNPPPVITCPPSMDVIAATPGSTTAIVNFTAPTVVDNCPGATVVCTPASGSAFPLGVTQVNCTATDSGGATASCSFEVTVWDASIRDDSLNYLLLFNTFTGDYKFTNCELGGFVMRGRGYITRIGCETTLRDDTRIIYATIDRCMIAPLNRGTALIKRYQPDLSYPLTDRNVLNNSPTCP